MACGDDTTSSTPAPLDAELTTIAVARSKKLGDVAKVEGFVSVAPVTFFSATGDLGFAIQDETAGIYVNVYDNIAAPLGTKVRVLGQLLETGGQRILASGIGSITILNDPKVQVVPKDITTGSLNESVEGLLVRVVGKVSKAPVDDKSGNLYYGVNTAVDDGTGEARIYVPINGKTQTPVIATDTMTVGATVEIIGFAQQFGTTYEIDPRRSTDLVVQ